jgi:hypothetical protein
MLVLGKQAVEGSRGVPWQLFHQVRGVFLEMLRRNHVVLSIFMAQEGDQVVLTLTQRVTVRACIA